MDRISAMLVNLLLLSTPPQPGAGGAAVQFIPPDALADALLADLADGAARALFADTLRTVADGRQDLGSGYAAVAGALRAVEELPERRALLDARLTTLNGVLGQALAIQQVLCSPVISAGDVRLPDAQVFRVIQEIAVPRAEGGPELVLVGALPGGRHAVRLARHPLLDRIQISYEAHSPYPRLTLSSPSRSDMIDWAPVRTGFEQKDTPDDALNIENRKDRHLGRIATTRVPAPAVLASGTLTLRIDDAPGTGLLMTTIVDADDAVLARCVRVIPAPAP